MTEKDCFKCAYYNKEYCELYEVYINFIKKCNINNENKNR